MPTPRALITAAAVGASAFVALAGPAGAAEKPVARYHLEHAWPLKADGATAAQVGGNVEFEWKVEEGES